MACGRAWLLGVVHLFPSDPEDKALIRKLTENPTISVHPVVQVHRDRREGLLCNPHRFAESSSYIWPRSLHPGVVLPKITRPEYTVRLRWQARQARRSRNLDNQATAISSWAT